MIYIIDQFSLNTNLPLDNRYIPDNGRLDPDISIYKYPGMQVYDSSTESIWYTDNNLIWQELGHQVDGSVSDLYNIVNDLSTLVYIHEASIGDIYNITNQLDASIVRIDTSLNAHETLLQIHDASIGDLYIQISTLDASISNLITWQISQDASITNINNHLTSIDSSIDNINTYQGIQDVSIIANQDHLISVDASITDINTYQGIQDVSIALNTDHLISVDASITDINTYQGIQDTSISDLQDQIDNIDSSLDDYVKKSGDDMTGPLTITYGPGNALEITGNTNLTGNEYISGDVHIGGSLVIDGSVTSVDTVRLDVSTNFINLNEGLTGTPPEFLQSGIVVNRGDESPYVFLFDETDDTFRIGVANLLPDGSQYSDASTQAVATREDNPIVNGIAVWNDIEDRFDTYSGFTFDNNLFSIDTSVKLTNYNSGSTDLTLVVAPDGTIKAVPTADGSINDLYTYIDGSLAARDASITQNILDIEINTNHLISVDASIVRIDTYQGIQDVSILANTDHLTSVDASIVRIDSSVTDLYQLIDAGDSSVKGAINIGDGSANVYAGLTTDGSLQFRTISGIGAAVVTENGDQIEISIDASFGGEVNTASNLGDGEGIFAQKVGQDLQFKSIKTNDPSSVIISSDTSTITIDVSIASKTTLVDLEDTSINEVDLINHSNIEWDADSSLWINANNLVWDISLGTTTDDLGGITPGTDLEGKTLKEILFKILYEYQVPNLIVDSSISGGIYEKGLSSTQFTNIDINWEANNNNYPLALLNNIEITKTGDGTIYEASLGLVSSDIGTYTDNVGITNWGGTDRTINYNVYISDDQADQTQPAIVKQSSFTFYYRQYWGIVPGNTNTGDIDSALAKGLSNNRLAGKTELDATFDNPTEVFVKYLFVYPDTTGLPDNFGTLSQIIDQNNFDLTDSFETGNFYVDVDGTSIRYRYYLSKHKVDTQTFGITFKF